MAGARRVTDKSERSPQGRTRSSSRKRAASGSSLTLRPYQAESRAAFESGLRRQILIWHRRAGKDIFALDLAADEARDNVGTYWHLYPTHVQARRAIWNGIDARAGVKFLERAFPIDERKSTRSQDMQIELDSGSIWQLCGSDRYDSLVGSNPRGVVFSEFALCDPRAWDYIRPIIRENGGWVIFITTYRGRNHAYRMVQRLRNNPDWYVDVRTVDDTTDQDGNPILTADDIQAERADGMSEAMIRQEYYCDPVAALPGAIYGKSLERLLQLDRAGTFGYDSSLPVVASWSLEWDDQYTVSFWQSRGNENRVIGSASFPFESLSNAIDAANQTFPWRYTNRHILPYGTSAAKIEAFENRGIPTDVAPNQDDTVTVTRDFLSTCYLDNVSRPWTDKEPNNERLVDALNGYRFAATAAGDTYTTSPVNSWERHYARSLEVYATYRTAEPLHNDGWYPAASTALQDRAAI